MLTSDGLLRELENLSRAERYRRVVEVGRAARACGDGSKERLALVELSRSAVPYERLTGALGLWQSGCSSETLRLLKDPCDRVSRLAMLPAAELLSDEDLLRAFEELPPHRLGMLCGYLERKGRVTILVDSYVMSVSPVTQKGTGLTLLCWASVDALAAQPTSAFYLLRKSEWGTLVRRNAEFAVNVVLENVNRCSEACASAVLQAHTVLEQLRRFHPSVGVRLLCSVLPRIRVKNECVEAYGRMYPAEVARMLKRCKVEGALEATRFFKKLDPEALVSLFEAGAFRGSDFRELFVYAPHRLRALLYERYRGRLLDPDGSMDISLIELIPDRVEREREALRALKESESLRLDPKRWVLFVSPLPFAQAVEVGKQYLREKDVSVRAGFIAAVVYGGQYHRECLDDILDFCIARGGDNDVVRGKFLMRLSVISRGKWKEHHMPKLAGIIKAALDARDVSSSSLDSCMALTLGTAHVSTVVVESSLVALVRRVGPPFDLGRYHLPRSSLLCIWSCLRPLMQEESRSGRHMKEGILRMFSFYLRGMSEDVVPYLRMLCDDGGDMVSCGISTLLRYFPAVGREVLPSVVARKPDVMSMLEVCLAVSNDLQGRLLEGCLTQGVLEDIARRGGFPRRVFSGRTWTAAKQLMYANSVVGILRSKGEQWLGVQCLLGPLESMYSVDVAEVASALLREDSEPPALRDRFIELLGRVENPACLQFLLGTLDDTRSRVSIHAIRGRAATLPRGQVLQIAERAMRSRLVAVQKVGVRLCAMGGDGASHRLLMQLREGGAMDEGVEVVWIQAMFNFIGEKDTWVYFHDAARDERRCVALGVVDVPADALEADWQFVALCKVFVLLLNHADTYVVVQALERLSRGKLPMYDEGLINCLFHLLDTRRQSEYFPTILHAIAVSSADAPEIARRLVSVSDDWALSANVHVHCARIDSLGERFKDIVASMAELLVQEGRQPAIVCHLVCWLRPAVAGEYLARLCVEGCLHPGCACAFMESAGNFGSDTEGVTALEERLRGHEDPVMQRIGLELLRRVACSAGWDEMRCEALQTYRHAADPWVRDSAKALEAQNVFESFSSHSSMPR